MSSVNEPRTQAAYQYHALISKDSKVGKTGMFGNLLTGVEKKIDNYMIRMRNHTQSPFCYYLVIFPPKCHHIILTGQGLFIRYTSIILLSPSNGEDSKLLECPGTARTL